MSNTKSPFIRIWWGQKTANAKQVGLPEFGQFWGTIRTDLVRGYYPDDDQRYLKVSIKGSPDAEMVVLRADVHHVEPTLAAVYPLPAQGGQA